MVEQQLLRKDSRFILKASLPALQPAVNSEPLKSHSAVGFHVVPIPNFPHPTLIREDSFVGRRGMGPGKDHLDQISVASQVAVGALEYTLHWPSPYEMLTVTLTDVFRGGWGEPKPHIQMARMTTMYPTESHSTNGIEVVCWSASHQSSESGEPAMNSLQLLRGTYKSCF